MSNVIKDYNIQEARKGALSLGEVTDMLLQIYLMIPEERRLEFDKKAKDILTSYEFLTKRLMRSESERFNK